MNLVVGSSEAVVVSPHPAFVTNMNVTLGRLLGSAEQFVLELAELPQHLHGDRYLCKVADELATFANAIASARQAHTKMKNTKYQHCEQMLASLEAELVKANNKLYGEHLRCTDLTKELAETRDKLSEAEAAYDECQAGTKRVCAELGALSKAIEQRRRQDTAKVDEQNAALLRNLGEAAKRHKIMERRLADAFAPICVMCLDLPSIYASAPCGHLALCNTCVAKSKGCPICRQTATSTLRVYPS